MLHHVLLCAFPLLVGSAPAEEGSVLRLEPDTQKMILLVGTTKHTITASDVELLRSDGTEAQFEDFRKDARVEVSFEKKKVTRVQLVKASREVDLRLTLKDGSVLRLDHDSRQIVLLIGKDEYTIAASDVELLWHDGTEARFEDFRKDAKVGVTFEGEKITKVQMLQ